MKTKQLTAYLTDTQLQDLYEHDIFPVAPYVGEGLRIGDRMTSFQNRVEVLFVYTGDEETTPTEVFADEAIRAFGFSREYIQGLLDERTDNETS